MVKGPDGLQKPWRSSAQCCPKGRWQLKRRSYEKEIPFLFLAASLLVQLTACAAPGGEASQAASSQPAASQPAQEQPAGPEAAPQIGEEIAGFTLTSVEPFAPLDANLLSFTHTVSGAQLLYIQNDDTNRAFAVAYRPPRWTRPTPTMCLNMRCSPPLENTPATTCSLT